MTELTRLYESLDAEIARLGWQCRACGKCCRFAEHGHELFCSELEASRLAEGADVPEDVTDEQCPYLLGRGCSRRDRRTVACRTYFCDLAGSEELAGLSERYIRKLKRLHERLGKPWRYARLSEHLNRLNANGIKG